MHPCFARVRIMSLAIGFVLVAACGMPVQPAHAQYTSYDSLTYAVVGGRPLHLALRIPAGASPAHPVPCVIWIHGGGWSGGSWLPVPGVTLPLVAQKQIAVASVEYRLTSQSALWGGEPVIFPAQIHDVKGAVRWLRAHAATYGIDPTRIGCWGSSAGGHLSALLGTSGGVAALEGTTGGNPGQSSAVQAWADYFGPTDILRMNLLVTTPPGSGIDHDAPASPESHLVGWDDPGQGIGDIRANESNPAPPYPALVALIGSANPVTWVASGDPPGIIAHGDQDTTVPLGCSRVLHEALTAAGVPHEYRISPGAGHGAMGAAIDSATVAFLAARLAPRTEVDAAPADHATAAVRIHVHPNPARGACSFVIAGASMTDAIEILDVNGRRVTILAANGAMGNGHADVAWDGRDEGGRPVPTGMYLAHARGERRLAATRFVVLR